MLSRGKPGFVSNSGGGKKGSRARKAASKPSGNVRIVHPVATEPQTKRKKVKTWHGTKEVVGISTSSDPRSRSSESDIMSIIQDMKEIAAPVSIKPRSGPNKLSAPSLLLGKLGSSQGGRQVEYFAQNAAKEIGDKELWNQTVVFAGEGFQNLVSVSEAARVKDSDFMSETGVQQTRAMDLLLESARWRAMKRLAKQFQLTVGEYLGSSWPRHFEKWLYSRRSACAGSRNSDPIFPHGEALMHDPELQRKLVAGGMAKGFAVSLCKIVGQVCGMLRPADQCSVSQPIEVAQTNTPSHRHAYKQTDRSLSYMSTHQHADAPTHQYTETPTHLQAAAKSSLSVSRANLGSGKKGRVIMEEIEMVEGERRRVKLRLSCGGMAVEVNQVHFEKLRALYRGAGPATSRGAAATATAAAATSGAREEPMVAKCGGEELVGAAFRVLARYSAFQGSHFKAGWSIGVSL